MRIASMPTNGMQRKGRKQMHNTTAPLPVTSDPGWSKTQRRLLTVLEEEGHRTKTIKEICQLAGYASESTWKRALRDERFAAVVHTFDIKRNRKRSAGRLSDVQQRLLGVLQQEQHQQKSIAEVCQLAGCTPSAWRWALKDEQFLKIVEALDVTFCRNIRTPHLEVTLATNVEEELAKDVWDMRRLKHEYPKHCAPHRYEVAFSWMVNPYLREQVKRYFRQHLTRWEAITFKSILYHLKPLLSLLPPEVHMPTSCATSLRGKIAEEEEENPPEEGNLPRTRGKNRRKGSNKIIKEEK